MAAHSDSQHSKGLAEQSVAMLGHGNEQQCYEKQRHS